MQKYRNTQSHIPENIVTWYPKGGIVEPDWKSTARQTHVPTATNRSGIGPLLDNGSVIHSPGNEKQSNTRIVGDGDYIQVVPKLWKFCPEFSRKGVVIWEFSVQLWSESQRTPGAGEVIRTRSVVVEEKTLAVLDRHWLWAAITFCNCSWVPMNPIIQFRSRYC